ncbi:MAG: outer membrane beta-barrel protein [Bacteroidetes bacterium]|nr:outer membrane beta-barrel protein [Bacteroidota bacterium]
MGVAIQSRAQHIDSVRSGTVDGLILDSAQHYALQSASIAIYVQKDTSLVSYQLSDNFGKFHFERIPVGVPLLIKGFYIGYKSVSRRFQVSLAEKAINLGALSLGRADDELEEVVVKANPPVRMNGDTLEFNADAFKLDKNAVGEDLLRKLPGVTIWGDGAITVYGKPVNQVLVDGKLFFGGDAKIATQNIPKDAIDKIQIYQQSPNRMNLRDSVTNLNIKLKKNKRFGYFGKIAAGYGTGRHYEGDASVNFFNPKTQLGIVGAVNNVNKIAGDASVLMRTSTYKGVGANVEYQTDFATQGNHRPREAGMIFQHDFLGNSSYYNKRLLSADYFLKDNTSDLQSNSHTLISLGGDSTRTQTSANTTNSSATDQRFKVRYDRFNGYTAFYAGASLNTSRRSNEDASHGRSYSAGQLQSSNDAENSGHTSSKDMMAEVELSHAKAFSDISGAGGVYDIKYSWSVGSSHGDRVNKTSYRSYEGAVQNLLFNRNYRNDEHHYQHLLLLSGDLSRPIFGYHRMTMPVLIQVKNDLSVSSSHGQTYVTDKDSATGANIANQYLSNKRETIIYDDKPALMLGKRWSRELDNRYSKIWELNFYFQEQLYSQKNAADHAFQNIKADYSRFVPYANLSWSNSQFGYFQDVYALKFSTSSEYPTIDQWAPIVDSSNQYNIQGGNRGLKPADRRELSFSFGHSSMRMKDPFNYKLVVTAGIVDHSFSDSSRIDISGRSVHYTVNGEGSRYLHTNLELNKAYKFRDNQIQIGLDPGVSWSRSPNNVNGIWNYSNNLGSDNSISLYYTYKDRVALNLRQQLSWYRGRQSALEQEFSNTGQATAFSASVNCTRRFMLNSNITYNHSTSTGSGPVSYTIWNASVVYRLLPGNNLELKLAALDLLHQNTSVVNSGSNNILTHTTSSVLQQYFMFTVAFYPRQFGKEGR